MFRVVIQLGAILAVVVLFWNKLWPFGLRHGRVCSKPAVWQLWFKVVAATIPVLIISPLDDWFETRFYNYITVAAMLILYGVLFILVENRRTAPHVTRLEQITYREAFIVGVWQMLAIIDVYKRQMQETSCEQSANKNRPSPSVLHSAGEGRSFNVF